MKTVTKWNEPVKVYPWNDGPIRVEMVGITHCTGHYIIHRHRSTVTVIEYILQGTGYVTVEGIEHPVTADHIYILPQGEEHHYRSSAGDPWVKVFINLTGELPPKLLASFGLSGQWLFDGRGLRDIFQRIAAIVNEEETQPGEEAALVGLFTEALFRLHRCYAQEPHSAEAVRLKEYLDCNSHRLVGNRELAAQIFRSQDYCIKLFKREFGTTPYDYQIGLKMQVTESLLRNSSLSVKRIGAQVGYPDPGYFSGLFRRKVGISPREYRKKYAGK